MEIETKYSYSLLTPPAICLTYLIRHPVNDNIVFCIEIVRSKIWPGLSAGSFLCLLLPLLLLSFPFPLPPSVAVSISTSGHPSHSAFVLL